MKKVVYTLVAFIAIVAIILAFILESATTVQSSDAQVKIEVTTQPTIEPTATPESTEEPVEKVQIIKNDDGQYHFLGKLEDVVEFFNTLSKQEALNYAVLENKATYGRMLEGYNQVCRAEDNSWITVWELEDSEDGVYELYRIDEQFPMQDKEGVVHVDEERTKKVAGMSDSKIDDSYCEEHIALKANAVITKSYPNATNILGTLKKELGFEGEIFKALGLVSVSEEDFVIVWNVCGDSDKKEVVSNNGSSNNSSSGSKPSVDPTKKPNPTKKPEVTAKPTPSFNPEPTADPTKKPEATAKPTPSFNPEPTADPTKKPEATAKPTPSFNPEPTADPTKKPATTATPAPSFNPETNVDPTKKPEATKAPQFEFSSKEEDSSKTEASFSTEVEVNPTKKPETTKTPAFNPPAADPVSTTKEEKSSSTASFSQAPAEDPVATKAPQFSF